MEAAAATEAAVEAAEAVKVDTHWLGCDLLGNENLASGQELPTHFRDAFSRVPCKLDKAKGLRRRFFEAGRAHSGGRALLLFDFYLSLRREAAVEADQYSGCILVENSNLTTWTHDDGLNSLG